MRAYGIIRSTFWLRGSGKRLRGNSDAQVLALYLMTCSQGTMCGIFNIALPTVANDTGIPVERVGELLGVLREIATYDPEEELCWVPNAAREQIGLKLSLKDKKRPTLIRELKQFGRHRFVAEFFQLYKESYSLDAEWSTWSGLGRGMQGSDPIGSQTCMPLDQVQVQVQAPDKAQAQAPDKASVAETSLGPRDPRSAPEPAQERPDSPSSTDTSSPSTAQPRVSSAPQSGVWQTTPRSYSEVIAMPIKQRAEWYVANLHQFNGAGTDWAQPHKWREVVEPLTALADAEGRAVRIGGYSRDTGVQRLVSHYADGWTLEELVEGYRAVPSGRWWQEKRSSGNKPGPSWITAEVLRRALDKQHKQLDTQADKLIAMLYGGETSNDDDEPVAAEVVA